jgi:acyl-CoA dehydrogenase
VARAAPQRRDPLGLRHDRTRSHELRRQALETSAVADGDEWVINGEKFYVSGAGDLRCRILIVMVRTNADADTYKQHSQVLVPIDTPGVEIVGPMLVFGADHAPHGHMHIRFHDVRVPINHVLLGVGHGFEISQMRLGFTRPPRSRPIGSGSVVALRAGFRL